MPCDTVSSRFISASCTTCSRRLDHGEKVHIVQGKYYCGEHCPEHSAQQKLDLPQEATPPRDLAAPCASLPPGGTQPATVPGNASQAAPGRSV